MAVIVRDAIFRGFMPFSLAEIASISDETAAFIFKTLLKEAAVGSSETMVNLHLITWGHILECIF
jgi:hypothetical protein